MTFHTSSPFFNTGFARRTGHLVLVRAVQARVLWFEVWEACRRLLLTARQTGKRQPAVRGMLVSGLAVVVQAKMWDFLNERDNVLALVANCEIYLVMMTALLMKRGRGGRGGAEFLQLDEWVRQGEWGVGGSRGGCGNERFVRERFGRERVRGNEQSNGRWRRGEERAEDKRLGKASVRIRCRGIRIGRMETRVRRSGRARD